MIAQQDINGPFDLLYSVVTHPASFINRLFGRRPSEYLTSAVQCNFTFYPPLIGGETTEETQKTVLAWDQFVDHCR